MNNMPYSYIPDFNTINSPFPFNSKTLEIEERLNRLTRDVRRLEHRINLLEKKNQPYIAKTNIDDNNDSGIYMM